MSGFLTSDVVAAVLAHLPGDQFRSTSTEIQAGFRQLADKYPQLFGHLSFGKVGACVSSPTVEAALDSLAASGFYSCYTKGLVTYHQLDKEQLTEYYDRFLKQRFASSNISVDIIKEAAESLQDGLRELRETHNLELLLVV